MSDADKDDVIRNLERRLRWAHDSLPCQYEKLYHESRERHVKLTQAVVGLASEWHKSGHPNEARELNALLTKETSP